MRDIGKNIKLLREEKNLTQDDLAEKLFVTRQTVSNYETGRSRPDVEMLVKIAEALGVDANTVLYGPEPEQHHWEKRKLAVGLALCLVLAALWFWLQPVFKAHKQTTYDTVPLVLLHMLVFAPLLAAVGWTAMQGSHVYLGTKKPKENQVRWIRRGAWIVLGLWFVLVVPMLVDLVRLDVTRWLWVTADNFTSYSSADFVLPQPWQSIVWNPVSSALLWGNLNLWGLFPFLGAALWLGGFPRGRKSDA